MTENEKKALALVNEVVGSGSWTMTNLSHPYNRVLFQALCRALEQHEAYKQEVSDAVKQFNERWGSKPIRKQDWKDLTRFIIPKPVDPLVEALASRGFSQLEIGRVEEALAARGGRIVFDQPEGGEG